MPSPFTSNNVFFCSTRSVNGGIAENPGKKQRVAKLARARDITVHAFMVASIENLLVVEETRAAFLAEAEKRAAQFRKTGKAIPADEVFDFLRKRVEGKPAVRPKARKLP